MIELTLTEWTELIELSDDEFKFRTDYSGRGMYGRTCPALVGSVTDYVKLVAAIAFEIGRWEGSDDLRDWDEVAKMKPRLDALVSGASVDSMGLDQVFYWPHIRIVADNDDVIEEAP